MFQSLRDYPRNFIDLYYKDYSNGIISGAEVLVEGNYIIITKGIVKYAGRIYMLENEYKQPYYFEKKEVIIKIRFIDKASYVDRTHYGTELFLDLDINIKKDELELGRFKLREGAKLRAGYGNFEELSTECNMVNIIRVEYAGLRNSTISIVILRYFAMEIIKIGSVNLYDVAFSMQCMNEERINREVILQYISNRLGIGYKECSNEQIYQYLKQILKTAKREMQARRK